MPLTWVLIRSLFHAWAAPRPVTVIGMSCTTTLAAVTETGGGLCGAAAFGWRNTQASKATITTPTTAKPQRNRRCCAAINPCLVVARSGATGGKRAKNKGRTKGPPRLGTRGRTLAGAYRRSIAHRCVGAETLRAVETTRDRACGQARD